MMEIRRLFLCSRHNDGMRLMLLDPFAWCCVIRPRGVFAEYIIIFYELLFFILEVIILQPGVRHVHSRHQRHQKKKEKKRETSERRNG